MRLFDRLSNGWRISMNSFKVLKENKQLLLFPILSGISLMLILGSFVVMAWTTSGGELSNLKQQDRITDYAILFLYYLINYFIVVFFNTALMFCTRSYFNGEEVSIRKGLQFSVSRLGAIFSWAVFAAIVGTILRIIQENVGSLGKIITGIIGVVWSIATFFVVPVIAFEDLGPVAAFKRSTRLMKEKWGESLASTFSFGLIQFLAIIVIVLPLVLIGVLIHPLVAFILGALGLLMIIAVMSAVQNIFISAVYHNMNGDPVKNFNEKFAENLFVHK